MSKITTDNYGNKVWRNEARQYHRVDGPTYITSHGTQAWCIDGLRHRLDGPAIIHADGTQQWYFNDIRVTHQVVAWIKENNFPDYALWTDGQKIMFRLAFSGN